MAKLKLKNAAAYDGKINDLVSQLEDLYHALDDATFEVTGNPFPLLLAARTCLDHASLDA